jgi:hypothetical protein
MGVGIEQKRLWRAHPGTSSVAGAAARAITRTAGGSSAGRGSNPSHAMPHPVARPHARALRFDRRFTSCRPRIGDPGVAPGSPMLSAQAGILSTGRL